MLIEGVNYMKYTLPPDIDRLIKQLKSPDSGQRVSAATGLARLDCHGERVILALVEEVGCAACTFKLCSGGMPIIEFL